jgi:hypothetical protein
MIARSHGKGDSPAAAAKRKKPSLEAKGFLRAGQELAHGKIRASAP